MILTPIKPYSFSHSQNTSERNQTFDSQSSIMSPDSNLGRLSDVKDSAAGGIQQHNITGCESESGGAVVPEGDLPGQFTRVMGKGKPLF